MIEKKLEVSTLKNRIETSCQIVWDAGLSVRGAYVNILHHIKDEGFSY